MSENSETFTIDGVNVIVNKLVATEAVPLKTELIILFGPSIIQLVSAISSNEMAPVLSSVDIDNTEDNTEEEETDNIKEATLSGIMDREVSFNELSKAFESLMQKVKPDVWMRLLYKILSCCRVQVQEQFVEVSQRTFNMIFTGRLKFMYKLAFKSLIVNYNDFFEGGDTGLMSVVSPIWKKIQKKAKKNL